MVFFLYAGHSSFDSQFTANSCLLLEVTTSGNRYCIVQNGQKKYRNTSLSSKRSNHLKNKIILLVTKTKFTWFLIFRRLEIFVWFFFPNLQWGFCGTDVFGFVDNWSWVFCLIFCSTYCWNFVDKNWFWLILNYFSGSCYLLNEKLSHI